MVKEAMLIFGVLQAMQYPGFIILWITAALNCAGSSMMRLMAVL